jgi:MinD superfamily P-loop ATPase
MVDNAQGEIKHTCNCCGCYCWNVGIIKRRKIPRDRLMAVHFIRETDSEACIACGACADICPVAAVELSDDYVRVDPDWCIGCGVCAIACPTGAVSIQRRSDARSPENFRTLHDQIKLEKGI